MTFVLGEGEIGIESLLALPGLLELSYHMDQVLGSRPTRIAPKETQWRHDLKDGKASYTFPGYSFTILRLE